ncbi:MAG TPA: hypothetical protein VJV05_00415 [Pyrinomonadaceae bacterium]|nr:hypothetical protein [Pyrinomonadaceae bacterium]
MKRKILRVFFTLIAILAGSSTESLAQNQRTLAQAQKISGDTFTINARTPKGANVVAVKKPSAAVLAAIDKGLTDLFAVSRKNGYTRRLTYPEYTIYIANADRTKDSAGSYSPGIAVGAAQYAGTEYDKGGYIYAAGMVIGFNQMAFLIAEHSQSLNLVSDIVRFEGEHLVLYHNDRNRYSQTADHSRGGGHPILN